MKIVAIGGSAGALEALRSMFSVLGVQSSAAFAIVIHIPPTGPSLLAQVIGTFTAMPVREAEDQLALVPGTVVVPAPDHHLLLEKDHSVSLSRDPAVHYSRPAIDPMFESAAHAFRASTIGVLLTGANEDGAAGLTTIRTFGGRVAIQDPSTAASPEMPMAGLVACGADHVGTPASIGRWLAGILQARGEP